jgi:L-aspartate oxidase
MKENEEFDAIIVGSGLAGLFVALNLPADYNILLITKSTIDQSDSFLAQGGICVLPEESDYDSFMEDTLKAGRYENKREAVAVMISESQRVIGDLIATGVEFDRKSSGDFAYTREAAHSRARILHARDATGQEICSKLASKVAELGNVRIIEKSKVLDILVKDNRCFGVVASIKGAPPKNIYGKNVILATGGVGGLFDRSTNYPHITGDALAIAHYNNVRLKDMNLVQIHPTSLYTEKPGRAFLISEAVRGEGAVLLDKNMNRFVDELLPRDLVSEAIYSQMKKDGKPYVWLCLAGHTDVDIALRFPEIYKHCLDEGFDITKECIPVVPAQHYFMGGIEVDLRSRTSMDNLYAVGETSCNGVHGRNRLASNSLLESLVFSRRAALDIAESGEKTKRPEFPKPGLDFYKNIDEKYNRLVLQEIGKKEKDD